MTSEKAVENFNRGYNCSQSVLLAFSDEINFDINTASRLSTPFGGGIGRQGKMCGCVSGAIMVLGLKFGDETTESTVKRAIVYSKTKDFCERFLKTHGSLDCKDLIKYDISKNDQYDMAVKNKIFNNRCSRLVHSASEIIKELYDKE